MMLCDGDNELVYSLSNLVSQSHMYEMSSVFNVNIISPFKPRDKDLNGLNDKMIIKYTSLKIRELLTLMK